MPLNSNKKADSTSAESAFAYLEAIFLLLTHQLQSSIGQSHGKNVALVDPEWN